MSAKNIEYFNRLVILLEGTSSCHLTKHRKHTSLKDMKLKSLSYVIMENIFSLKVLNHGHLCVIEDIMNYHKKMNVTYSAFLNKLDRDFYLNIIKTLANKLAKLYDFFNYIESDAVLKECEPVDTHNIVRKKSKMKILECKTNVALNNFRKFTIILHTGIISVDDNSFLIMFPDSDKATEEEKLYVSKILKIKL